MGRELKGTLIRKQVGALVPLPPSPRNPNRPRCGRHRMRP